MSKKKVPMPPAPDNKVKHEIKEEIINAVVDGVNMNLNVRKEPKVDDGNVLSVIPKGTKVIVITNKPVESNGEHWLKIRFGNPPKEGYAMKKYIKIV